MVTVLGIVVAIAVIAATTATATAKPAACIPISTDTGDDTVYVQVDPGRFTPTLAAPHAPCRCCANTATTATFDFPNRSDHVLCRLLLHRTVPLLAPAFPYSCHRVSLLSRSVRS